MRTPFIVLTLETDISKSMGLIDEMHRDANQFTGDEMQQQLLIRRHLAEAAAITRLLVNSVLTRAQSRDVHQLVEAVEKKLVSARAAGGPVSGPDGFSGPGETDRDPGDENDALLRTGAQTVPPR